MADQQLKMCPICNLPVDPNDPKNSVDYYSLGLIHRTCVERADELQRHNPNNSYT